MRTIDTKKLAEKLFCFLKKYDEQINKYKKSEIYLGKNIIDKTSAEYMCAFKNRVAKKIIEPFYSLTKGKEIEELERLIKVDLNFISNCLRLSDFIRDDIVDLTSNEIKEYDKTNNHDENIFSNELIEKSKLLKEYDKICEELYILYENIKHIENEEEAEA